MGDDNKAKLKEDFLHSADCTTPALTEYWRNLITFDKLNKATTTTSEDGPEYQ